MIKFCIILFCISLLFPPSFAQYQTINKISTITYLGNGIARYEMELTLLPNVMYVAHSDAIEANKELFNVLIKLGDEIIDTSNYDIYWREYSNTLYIAEIALRSEMKTERKTKLYIKFDFFIWQYKMLREGIITKFNLKFFSSDLYTEPPLEVKHTIKLLTNDSLYEPSARKIISDYSVKLYKQGTYLYRNYKSDNQETINTTYFIDGISYTNYSNSPTQEIEKFISISENNLIREELSQIIIGLTRGTMIFNYDYTLPFNFHILSAPKLSLNINGINPNLMRVPADSIIIYEYRKFKNVKKYLYSWGDESNDRGDVLRVIFPIQRNEICKLSIKFNRTWEDQITSDDGFHYNFYYGVLGFFLSTTNDFEYVTIEAPKNFIITDFPFRNNVQNKSDNVISFRFNNYSEYEGTPLVIHFQRMETELFNILKVVNIISVILFIIMFIIFRWILKTRIKNIYLGKVYTVFAILNSFIIGWISFGWISTNYLKDAFLYTYAYLPIILSIILFFTKDKGQ